MPDDLTIRALLDTETSGVLATLSARRDGWPFASVAPYALSDAGEPLLLLSRLAEHTRNLQADARASLLVQDHASLSEPQAGARVTILGQIDTVVEPELQSARRRYLDRHPQAAAYLELGDFQLYVLRVREARFIGGFGDMGWMDAERFHASQTHI
ncbi:MAG TPA: pyridoxamine 5'-phosphate oxidase family protein [Chloroflexota bacterium]|nr:pyridoxamine 5'-phosphate oxidase family protein [Chloroflexota bacterium]